MDRSQLVRGVTVRDTEILPSDTRQEYRRKLARITLDSMVQFVGLIDAEGTVLEINKVALDAVGIQLSDVEGKPFWTTFWWGVSAEIQEKLRESIARAARGEFVRWDTEIYGRAGGRETIVVDASLCPVLDEDGRVVFIAAEGRDITEKKAYEREIAHKNGELQALLERIRELDEVKSQFFANVSHELRTPLALIIGPAQRLVDGIETMPSAERRDAAQVIARSARILLKHVNDLLDLSKLEAGKLKIELQDVDLGALTGVAASHFEVLARERQIDYRVDLPSGIVCAVDAEKLERVLMNLLSNAFKFTPEEGVIRCRLETASLSVVIVVEDSGPGVKPEWRRSIFERFRQGDGGANRKFGGTGLGLAIAKEFVEMHHGLIEVLDSDLGGALFRVVLPLRRLENQGLADPAFAERETSDLVAGIIEELRPLERRAVPAPSRTEQSTILVVEDNPDMNQFLIQALGSEYAVAAAFNGREGLAMAREVQPALIVTDVMMPVMSGTEMIAEIRADPELAEIPILVLSAKADEDLQVELLGSGVQDFITKPFSERDLRARARNLVGIYEARESERREAAVNEALSRVATACASELDQRKLLQVVTDEGTALTGAEFGAFFFNTPEDDAGAYHLYTISGAPPEPLSSCRLPVATPLLELINAGSAIRSNNVQQDPRFDHSAERSPFVSYIAAPVAGEDKRVLGGLIFAHGQPSSFNETHERIVHGLAAHASVALEKCRLYEAALASEARAREADRRKDEFLAMLGHELRNPLAPITTGLELLRMRGEPPGELAIIERQTANLKRLVDELLEASRIALGKITIERSVVEIASVVETALEGAAAFFEGGRQRLDISVPQTGLSVDGDPQRLAQVVTNLLANALKYSDSGTTVTIEAARNGGMVRLSVRDEGIGIEPDLLDQIFDMFEQQPQSLERSRGGLGLGLPIARKLVELHGGRIWAESAGRGCGSELYVELPLTETADHACDTPLSEHSSVPCETPVAAERILVVDDNQDGARLLAEVLTARGHVVETARDAASALIAFAAFAPTCGLLDIGLPGMNGYELAKRMRQASESDDLRLIAVTGYGQASDRERSAQSGFDAHLVKPAAISELIKVIASLRRRIP